LSGAGPEVHVAAGTDYGRVTKFAMPTVSERARRFGELGRE